MWCLDNHIAQSVEEQFGQRGNMCVLTFQRAYILILFSVPAVRFVADDDETFTGSIGMMLDTSSSALIGGPRSKVRMSIYALCAEAWFSDM